MKRYLVWLSLIFLLSGCSGIPDEMESAMQLRTRLQQSGGCCFASEITADYGDKIHIFSMDCQSDPGGDLSFTVTKPDTISGISGKLSGEGGKMIFDQTVLHFDLIAEEQISPIIGPWILLKALQSGYITSACRDDGMIRLSVEDSFDKKPLQLDIWLDAENLPRHADILYDGKRILSVAVANFSFL